MMMPWLTDWLPTAVSTALARAEADDAETASATPAARTVGTRDTTFLLLSSRCCAANLGRARTTLWRGTHPNARCLCRYLTSESILNMGRYIEMMMMPTTRPTAIIMIGSTIEVSDDTAASTSSS